MYHTDFHWRTGTDQLKIYGQVWQPLPGNEVKAVIALVHGMGEHSGRYRRFAEYLTGKGIAIISFDQRGHGKSQGKKGHITHYNQLLDASMSCWNAHGYSLKTNRFFYMDIAWAAMLLSITR